MKTTTLKLSAMAFAAALFGAIGCGSGGCGGTNINDNSSTNSTPSMQCGNGTYLNAQNQCVPRPATAAAPTAHPVSVH
jgi:hypothetical protein